MDRITVKLGRDTHRRLVAALPELSTEAGRMLTMTDAVEYLLAQHRRSPLAAAGVPANWGQFTDKRRDGQA